MLYLSKPQIGSDGKKILCVQDVMYYYLLSDDFKLRDDDTAVYCFGYFLKLGGKPN